MPREAGRYQLRTTDYGLRITNLAAGNEQSGKMERKTKRTYGKINTFKRKIALVGNDSAAEKRVSRKK